MLDVAEVGLGYVKLIDHMGSDLSVVNAARVSYVQRSTWLEEKDEKLIWFLASNHQASPFRHAFVTIEVKAPLMVARQWWKYVVGSDHTMDSWNEMSRRLATFTPEFYSPSKWYTQGDEESSFGARATERLQKIVEAGIAAYDWALEVGLSAEQARLMLPAYGMYTTWRWSASLQSLAYFLSQRLEEDDQYLIQEYAGAVYELTKPLFPISLKALGKHPIGL